MIQTLAEDPPCYMKKRAAEFRDSTEDEPRLGRPETSNTDEEDDSILCMLFDDRRFSALLSIGIRSGSVNTVLTEILWVSELSTRWVPRILTTEQKLKSFDISRTHLTDIQTDTNNLQRRLIT